MHFFFILSRREAHDTQHTPLALQNDDLTCTLTQMSQGGDLFEDLHTSTGGFEKCKTN